MPAITADTLALPRVSAAGPDRHRTPGPLDHHRAAWLRGRGVPGRPCVRRGQQRRTGSVRPHGPDGRGGIPAGRTPGHRLAPAPRIRDGHLHDRRPVRPPGFTRRRRADRRRRDSVDDGRAGHPAHRNAARRTRRERWAVPRRPALGEPAEERQVRHPAIPGHRRRRRRAAVLRRRRRADPRHRRRRSTATAGPVSRTRRSRWRTRRFNRVHG